MNKRKLHVKISKNPKKKFLVSSKVFHGVNVKPECDLGIIVDNDYQPISYVLPYITERGHFTQCQHTIALRYDNFEELKEKIKEIWGEIDEGPQQLVERAVHKSYCIALQKLLSSIEREIGIGINMLYTINRDNSHIIFDFEDNPPFKYYTGSIYVDLKRNAYTDCPSDDIKKFTQFLDESLKNCKEEFLYMN